VARGFPSPVGVVPDEPMSERTAWMPMMRAARRRSPMALTLLVLAACADPPVEVVPLKGDPLFGSIGAPPPYVPPVIAMGQPGRDAAQLTIPGLPARTSGGAATVLGD
jgi:hypothetical protein